MAIMYEADSQELIQKAATELKNLPEVEAPDWAIFVKTGAHKERPPVDKDWWYVRSASVLRTVYRLGPVGVSKLRTKYGGKKNRGHQTSHHYRASGNILRKVLQQLQKAGLVRYEDKALHRGRVITAKGRSMLDKIATSIVKAKPKVEAPKAEVKKEAKTATKEAKSEVKKEAAKAPAKDAKAEPKAAPAKK